MLLDISSLDSFFELIFGAATVRFEWIQTLEGIMLTSILLKEGKKFSKLAAVLQMTAEKHLSETFPEQETNLTEAMQQLSAYGEVAEGLQMIRTVFVWRH